MAEIEMTVDRWANLFREHLKQIDAEPEALRDYLVVQSYGGPVIIPPSQVGIIVVEEADGEFVLVHFEEILKALDS